MHDEKNPMKVKAGFARADALTAARRREIAQRAADSRWAGDLPQSDFEGTFRIGNTDISAAVLRDEKRIITQATFLRALGRSRSPKAGTGVLSTVNELPFFLQADVLQPFIDKDLIEATRPIFYRTKKGGKAVGYDARGLKKVAEVYLKFRDNCLQASGRVPARYTTMVKAADILIRALAEVGIVALVDEATGYQEVRKRLALQEILDAYLRKELAAWAKRFPDEFYKQIYRLRNWDWKGMQVNRPQVVANYTMDFVYERLAPGIVEELERRMPKSEAGRKSGKYHQLLTEDIGHPALAQHLHTVIALMRAARNWDEFKRMINQSLPKKGQNYEFAFVDEN